MTIYNLMLKVSILRFKVRLAYKSYKENKPYHKSFEDEAITVLDTLLDIGYISCDEYREYAKELYHIFRMYKRH